MNKLRVAVENQIGKVTNAEWQFAERDVSINNSMSPKAHLDETTVQRLITSIDFYRRHKLGA